jgi:hypothetical protein
MRRTLFLLIASSPVWAADWQTFQDRKHLCQISAADKIMTSRVSSPDKKVNVTFRGMPEGTTYADTVKAAKQLFKPENMIEESANRTWFASAPAAGKTGKAWYAVISGTPVCEIRIEAAPGADEETAKKIIQSLQKAK